MQIHKQHGFTLMEVMITVAIVGIVAAIAANSYSGQVISAKRTDARKALQETAITLEKCKAINGVYNNGCSIGGAPIASSEGLYSIAFTALTATAYTLTATPSAGSSQANDTDCTSLTLNNLSQQAGTGANSTVCW